MIDDPFFYAVAIPAVILLGLGKGGFAGVGNLSLPMVALAISPVRAAAILLPLLIAQDAVSVWAFRRSWNRRIVAVILPSAAIGIVGGFLFAAYVSPKAVMGALGTISVMFALQRLWIERRHAEITAAAAQTWVGVLCGVAMGFTSQIAHAGGPPFQIWVLPQRLARDVLVGTTAIAFAAVNWMKVPAYAALGQFTAPNMLTAAALLPVATASTLAGVWLVRRVPMERFYTIVYVLMLALGVKLLWDAFA